jgi:hypothetical protein
MKVQLMVDFRSVEKTLRFERGMLCLVEIGGREAYLPECIAKIRPLSVHIGRVHPNLGLENIEPALAGFLLQPLEEGQRLLVSVELAQGDSSIDFQPEDRFVPDAEPAKDLRSPFDLLERWAVAVVLEVARAEVHGELGEIGLIPGLLEISAGFDHGLLGIAMVAEEREDMDGADEELTEETGSARLPPCLCGPGVGGIGVTHPAGEEERLGHRTMAPTQGEGIAEKLGEFECARGDPPGGGCIGVVERDRLRPEGLNPVGSDPG